MPYARNDWMHASDWQKRRQAESGPSGTGQQAPADEAGRVSLRNQLQELHEFLDQGSIGPERARALCLNLYKDLGSPTINALWLQPMLYTLTHVAEDPQTSAEAKKIIHEQVLAYYEQQQLLQPPNEFVSPHCMTALGRALTASGDAPKSSALADSLRTGASAWFRRLGYEEEASELEDESRIKNPHVDDLVGELLAAYVLLLDERRELPRVELNRVQRGLCGLVRRAEIKSRRHWELWGRAMDRLGNRANVDTRDFVQQRIKTSQDLMERRAMQTAAKRLKS